MMILLIGFTRNDASIHARPKNYVAFAYPFLLGDDLAAYNVEVIKSTRDVEL